MQTTFALVAALAATAFAAPQATDQSGAVTSAVAPSGAAPTGAMSTYPGAFQLTVVNITVTGSAKAKRQSSTCGQAGTLTTTLNNGVLKDSQGRTGYIASNYQLQYDAPPQAGAIYTAGFSALSNGSLALGPSAIFYSCYTGGFSNLYDRAWAPQCLPVLLDIIPCAGSSSSGSSATGGVSQISDGQPQATTAVSQISDGQIQATTAASRTTSRPAVSQISDGQIQATSAASRPPVSQISDGQIQATSAASRPVVSQISDGQIQATSAASRTTSRPVVSQISDGQIQATAASNRTATSTPVAFTGAAVANGVTLSAALLGLVAYLL